MQLVYLFYRMQFFNGKPIHLKNQTRLSVLNQNLLLIEGFEATLRNMMKENTGRRFSELNISKYYSIRILIF